MYANESADQMSFSSSCSSQDLNCYSKQKMPKSYGVRRTNLSQLALVSLLLVTSLFPCTFAGPVSRSTAHEFCSSASPASQEKMSTSSESQHSPLFASIIAQCSATINKSIDLAKAWFRNEFGKEEYDVRIMTMQSEWKEKLPKTIHQPVGQKHLESLNEEATLKSLYENLTLIRDAVMEREHVATKTNAAFDRETFSQLLVEILQVIGELGYILPPFGVTKPEEKKSDGMRHENKPENDTERTQRNMRIFYGYITSIEYTNEIMLYLDKKYCNKDV